MAEPSASGPDPGPTRAQRLAKRIRVPTGFAVAALFLFLARPSLWTLLGSLPLVLPGLALRAYAAGYVRKNAELTTTGPYAYTRNPLYLGSLLIVLGFGLASASLVLLLLLCALFALIYIPTIQGEEQYLRVHFVQFDAYAAEVPRLLPRLSAARIGDNDDAPSGSPDFSPERWRHHREYNAVMGAGAMYAVLLVELFVRHLRR